MNLQNYVSDSCTNSDTSFPSFLSFFRMLLISWKFARTYYFSYSFYFLFLHTLFWFHLCSLYLNFTNLALRAFGFYSKSKFSFLVIYHYRQFLIRRVIYLVDSLISSLRFLGFQFHSTYTSSTFLRHIMNCSEVSHVAGILLCQTNLRSLLPPKMCCGLTIWEE